MGEFLLFTREYALKALTSDYSYSKKKAEGILLSLLSTVVWVLLHAVGYPLVFIAKVPLFSGIFESIARTAPRDAAGFFLRECYYKGKLRDMGYNVLIDVGAIVWNPENVSIGSESHIDTYVKLEGGEKNVGNIEVGRHVHIAGNVIIHGGGGVRIKDYAAVAAGTCVYSSSNYYKRGEEPNVFLSMSASAPDEMKYVVNKQVTIEEYAFIGLNSVVLPGVRIGRGAIVGANSLVINDIPDYSIAVGSPAKVISRRDVS
jgi:acetyltransferase-like isoleucine patch superfamily enzyme